MRSLSWPAKLSMRLFYIFYMEFGNSFTYLMSETWKLSGTNLEDIQLKILGIQGFLIFQHTSSMDIKKKMSPSGFLIYTSSSFSLLDLSMHSVYSVFIPLIFKLFDAKGLFPFFLLFIYFFSCLTSLTSLDLQTCTKEFHPGGVLSNHP